MEWISVNDRLPPDLEVVIVNVKLKSGKNKVYSEARWNKKEIRWEMPDLSAEDWWRTNLNITHWMALPEPPET